MSQLRLSMGELDGRCLCTGELDGQLCLTGKLDGRSSQELPKSQLRLSSSPGEALPVARAR